MAVIETRVASDGTTHHRVKVRLKGYPAQSATFSNITMAKKWAQQTEAAIREGRYFKTAEARRHTLAELIDRYILEILPHKPRSKAQQEAQLKWWKAQIGAHMLSDVTPALLAEYRGRLANTSTGRKIPRSPSTVIRYLAVLSHAFTIAVREWGWLEDNPMRKVTKPKEPKGRVRFLSEDEIEKLLKACKHSDCTVLYPIVVLAVSTGMRYGEIMGLRWQDIDLEMGRIILPDTKNGERRNVPITGHAYECIKELSKVRRIDTNLVFPGRNIGEKARPFEIRKSWNNALEVAEIKDFRFHDLRHTAASYLAMSSASLSEIAGVLGHKTLQMVQRYAHLSEAHTTKVVKTLNDRLFGSSNAA